MGGRGSTRWGDHDRKQLVEATPALDFLAPVWREALSQERASGQIEWTDARTGAPKGWADFHLGPVSDDGVRRL
jgi:hypothetical protein